MTIYVTEAKEIETSALQLLTERGHVLVDTAVEASARAAEIEALFIRTYTNVTAQYLAAFPNLKYVLRAGVGLDNIEVKECERRGIQVINAPGANANAVAEYIVGATIAAVRNFDAQTASLRAGTWRKPELMGDELKNKVLGLVGCGNVGRIIARKLSGWELKEIIVYDPYLTAEQFRVAGVRKCELSEVIEQADIISLHVPLIPETRHLIGEKQFARMKRGALLINAARGGIIDESALIRALTEKRIAGAIIDVFEREPNIHKELLAFKNVMLTPHIGGYTHEANREVSLAPVKELLHRLEQEGLLTKRNK